MNALAEKFGDRLIILAFPCNQFGHQEQMKNDEILNSLKYVRPGNGFEPRAIMFEKVSVNGAESHPLFQLLKEALPNPIDNSDMLTSDPAKILWKPVLRSDISWNFAKFLIGPDGGPIRRYSPKFSTLAIESDIEAAFS